MKKSRWVCLNPDKDIRTGIRHPAGTTEILISPFLYSSAQSDIVMEYLVCGTFFFLLNLNFEIKMYSTTEIVLLINVVS